MYEYSHYVTDQQDLVREMKKDEREHGLAIKKTRKMFFFKKLDYERIVEEIKLIN